MKGLVAVTGGTGFIGRRIVRRLVRDGWRVRALARRSRCRAERCRGRGRARQPGGSGAASGIGRIGRCRGALRRRDPSAQPRGVRPGQSRRHAAPRGGDHRPAEAAAAASDVVPGRTRAGGLALRGDQADGRGSGAPDARWPGRVLHRAAARRLRSWRSRHPADFPPDPKRPSAGACATRASPAVRRGPGRDRARLLDAPSWHGQVIEPDDGRGGYCWTDLARIAGDHLHRRVRTVPVPWLALWLPAALAQLMGTVLQRAPMMTLGKLRELYHADWVCQAGPGPCPGGSAAGRLRQRLRNHARLV